MNNFIKNIIKHYILAFIGLLIFLLFIWFRYIRTRLPKDIPFPYLSAIGFISIIFICTIYFLIIKNLVKPNDKKTILSEYVVPILYAPLESFDHFIKEPLNREKVIFYIANKLSYMIKNSLIFYMFFAIIPRIILVTVLVMDIFYFKQLYYIYYFLYLTILLFLNKYIIYSFKVEKKRLINETKILLMNESISTPYVPGVHPKDDPEDEDYEEMDPFLVDIACMSLPVDIFIDFQVKSIIYDNITREYTLNLAQDYHIRIEKEYKQDITIIPEKPEYWARIKNDKKTIIEPKINNIVELGCIIEYYNRTHYHNIYLKIIKVIIFALYLISWTYVLIKSVVNLDQPSFIALFLCFVNVENDPFIMVIDHIPFVDDLITLYQFLRYNEVIDDIFNK